MSIMDETETFTIQVTMKKRWIPHFLSMLEYMWYLGDIGSSREVAIYADGDGDFRPKFEWDKDLLATLAEPSRDSDGNRLYDAG